jgi:hypothetical protein
MYSNESILEVMQFVKNTPEGNLIKMLRDKEMTDVHVRLLVKLAKNCKDEEFTKCFTDETFPNLKMNNPEYAVKEKFWGICKKKLSSMGLLNLSKAA